MELEDARNLYDYNAWANQRMLAACEKLSPEQFTQKVVSSFPSVRATVGHIMWAEGLWLERWRGRSPSAAARQFATLGEIRVYWQPLGERLLGFVRGLSSVDLQRVVEYRNTKGTPFRSPMSHMLQHLVNHGTYHRGQVTTMLRQLDATPLATDLIAYFREQTGQPHN